MEQKKFELNTPIHGKNAMEYMAELLEKNERQEIEIERGKLSIGILKQMNNRSRLLLDAAKYELKSREVAEEAKFLEKERQSIERVTKDKPIVPASFM